MDKNKNFFLVTTLISVVISAIISVIMISIAFDHNPMEEYSNDAGIVWSNILTLGAAWFLFSYIGFMLFFLIAFFFSRCGSQKLDLSRKDPESRSGRRYH